ncbi:hypothetical protein [Brachybacterium hainanense]|uniref:Membrane protein involved in the export of O-antigen and teichoic acid n=1 Tax=Brachybacterium hainanense TaxID=1541174 RepID=A0ABV6R749_9MICO
MPGLRRRALDRLRAPLREVGLNTVAFAMIIAIQQLLVFPGLGRMLPPAGFSQVILLITISTIAVNVIGGEASKVALIRGEAYRSRALPWDAPRIVLGGCALIILAVVVLAVARLLPVPIAAPYALITVLGILRTFGTTPDKHRGAFHRVVLAHAAYAVGAVGGLLLVPATGSPFTPFLLAESLCVLVVLIIRRRHREVPLTLRRTRAFRGTLRPYLGLALIALLINAVTYLDRLLITPLLGAEALAIYYSASALSSSLALVTNPGGNALLARLGRMPDARRRQVFARGALVALPLVLLCWGASLVIAAAGLFALYPGHARAALPLLLPVSLAAAFSNASSLLAPLLQRFLPVRRLLGFTACYAAVYLLAVIVLSARWRLPGFAWATAMAAGALFALYLAQVRATARTGFRRAGPPGSARTAPADPVAPATPAKR